MVLLIAYKREVFHKIGYFDEELIRNQDDEFNFRLLKNGFTIYLFRKIRSKYYVRASYGKLFKQYEQYGYWKVYVNKKHNTVTTLRQVVPLFFVLYLLFGVLASFFGYVYFTLFAIGLLLYSSAGYLFAYNLSTDQFQITNIIRVFFILHFSYGWGYLKGMIDFFVLNKTIKRTESLTR